MTSMETIPNPIIRKVRALLAQAAGTSFEAEAQAFAAKAAALIEEHQIAEADLRDAGQAVGEIVLRTYLVPAPGSRALCSLLHTVCDNSAVSMIMIKMKGDFVVELYGTATAIAGVIAIFEALRIQVDREVLRVGLYERNLRSFRNSFIIGFAGRLRQRMEDARAVAKLDATTAGQVNRGGLVLMSDLRRAEEEMRSRHQKIRSTRPSTSSDTGYRAGASAADRADFGQRGLGSKRSAIGC